MYWDDKTIFMEHRFITPSDGFVRAIAICRQRLLDCNAEAIVGALINKGVKQNGNVEAGITQVNQYYLFSFIKRIFQKVFNKVVPHAFLKFL